MNEKRIWERLTDWEKSPVLAPIINSYRKWRQASLIKKLESGDSEKAWRAARKLNSLGNKGKFIPVGSVVSTLANILNDKNSKGRGDAAELLGLARDVNVRSLLYKALKDKDVEVQCGAARGLEKIGFDNIDQKVLCKLRLKKTNGIIKIGEPAVPALTDALSHSSPKVRKGAAWVLRDMAVRNIRVASATTALIYSMNDKDPDVRRIAPLALGGTLVSGETIEDLEAFEEELMKGSAVLRKEKNIDVRIILQIKIAKLLSKIAKKKDELAPKRDLLLDDRPKPPKKGRGVYQVSRRVRNG